MINGSCPAGQYDLFGCKDCPHDCSTCSTVSIIFVTCDTCTSSLQRYRVQKQGSIYECKCNDTYYDDGSNEECQPCTPQCNTCKSSTECKTCSTSLRNQTGPPSCNCPSHYLQDNTKQNCDECDAICKTCTGTVSNCSSCFEPERDPTKYCACSDGYVENASNTCLSCGPRCLTCQNYLNVNQCQTCKINRSTTPDCLCNLGFVEDINFNCLKCSYKCSTCNDPNDINLCENCSDTNREGDYCQCKDGYVDDGSNPTCLQCNTLCATCNNPLNVNECETCADPLKQGPTCTQCISGYVLSGTTCLQCNYKCATCSDPTDLTKCDTCSDINRDNNNINCACKPGYVDDGSNAQCLQCGYKCGTCSDSSDINICDTCANLSRGPTPNCDCKEGKVDDGLNNKICLTCNYPCKSCSDPNALDVCDFCVDSSFRDPSSADQKCPCISHYYDDTTPICKECSHKCLECETSSTNCSSCSDINTRDINDQCNCFDGFVDDGSNSVCLQCNYKCATCSDPTDLTICDTCSDINRDINNNCACKPGYVDDGFSEHCLKCDYKCGTCSDYQNLSQCDTCSDISRDININCLCKPQYVDDGINNSQCLSCNYPCGTCTDPSNLQNCDTCSDISRNSTSLTCDCLEGYVDNGIEQCIKCDYKCKSCSDPTNEYYCDDCADQNRILGILHDCQCKQGYYDDFIDPICQLCPKNSIQCHFEQNNQQIKVDQCKKGYFISSDSSKCLKCSTQFSQYCSECDINQCFECQQTNHYLIPICEQQQDQNDICGGDNVCQQCDTYSNCQTCLNDLVTCNSCDEKVYTLIDGQCVKIICDPKDEKLIEKHCLTCDSQQKICKTCEKNRYLNDNNECICKENTDKNGECQGVMQDLEQAVEQITEQGTTGVAGAFAASSSLLIFNPSVLLQMLDTLQQIRYTIYMQIEFPDIVYKYFEIFDMFNFEFLPNIVPINKYYLKAPYGFELNDTDGFFFRNVSQYFLISWGLLALYLFLRWFKYYIKKQKIFCLMNKRKLWGLSITLQNKVIDKFQYQVLLAGMVGSYLSTTIYANLQILTLEPQDLSQYGAKAISYVFLFIFYSLPVLIIYIGRQYLYLIQKFQKLEIKNNQNNKQKLQIIQKQKTLIEKQFGFIFADFKRDKLVQVSFYSVICFKKVVFGLILVYANNIPIFNQSGFLILNIIMIFLSIKFKPFTEKRHNRRFQISEFCFLLIHLSTYAYTILDFSEKILFFVAIWIIILSTLILLTEMIFSFYDVYLIIVDFKAYVNKIKIKLQKRKEKQLQRIENRRLLQLQKEKTKQNQELQNDQKINVEQKNNDQQDEIIIKQDKDIEIQNLQQYSAAQSPTKFEQTRFLNSLQINKCDETFETIKRKQNRFQIQNFKKSSFQDSVQLPKSQEDDSQGTIYI